MVLVVNKELKMGKGKIAAQCCHAAVACFKRAMKTCPAAVSAWERTGCAKIAVQCDSQDEMETIMVQAHQMGIPCYLVEDAGRTQIAAGSRTVLGLGPAPVRVYDGLTTHLKLMWIMRIIGSYEKFIQYCTTSWMLYFTGLRIHKDCPKKRTVEQAHISINNLKWACSHRTPHEENYQQQKLI